MMEREGEREEGKERGGKGDGEMSKGVEGDIV